VLGLQRCLRRSQGLAGRWWRLGARRPRRQAANALAASGRLPAGRCAGLRHLRRCGRAEIDLVTGLKLKLLDDKLTFDLGYIRYNYLGAPSDLFYDFNEFGLVAGYDFGVAQVSAAVRYSPNFFANSGNAWYKWASVTVPMPFLYVNENVAFKAFGTIGNQSVERFANYGIPNDNYWDWQLGATATVWGVDLTVAYTDTNIDVAGYKSLDEGQVVDFEIGPGRKGPEALNVRPV